MIPVTIHLDTDVAKQWNKLVDVFGNQNILFGDFIEFYKKNAQREIARIEVDLTTYEDKYNMASEVFHEKFERGELADSQDFIVWSGIYEMQMESKKKLAELS
ncbi:MAG: hypothetical protein WA958_21490 [Tunicatimonas sp.]